MDAGNEPVPAPVVAALSRWLEGFDRSAPGVVEGLYVVGSGALGDWTPQSDVDVVAVMADPTDPEALGALIAAHSEVQADLPVAVDGPFLGWGDLVVPPGAALRLWSQEGALHHDAECFELNPVTWWTLATHGIACRGDPAGALGVYADRDDVRRFVAENVDTYWRAIAAQIRDALADDPGRTEYEAGPFTWAVLGAARMLFSGESGEVRSKSAAGRWAAVRQPSFEPVLDLAVRRRAAPAPVPRAAVESAADFVERVVALVAPT